MGWWCRLCSQGSILIRNGPQYLMTASEKLLVDNDNRNLPTYNACHMTKRWFGMSTIFDVHRVLFL